MYDPMMKSEIDYRANRVSNGVRGSRPVRRRPVMRLGQRVLRDR